MGIKASLSTLYADHLIKKRERWLQDPIETQSVCFRKIISKARDTSFGQDHGFYEIKTHADFSSAVPIRDYEAARFYFDKIRDGEENVCWPGRPVYLAKTSGTTSGAKYIPITKESLPTHIRSAKMALLSYIHSTRKTDFVQGKMIFLQGSPVLDKVNGIMNGRLSGIVAHHVPSYLQRNRLPSFETNCIEDWETKVDQIVKETLNEDMRLISGIPSWVQMYFERLLQVSGKDTIKDIFPAFDLFVFGGVNFDPYRARFRELIGRDVDSIELFPASEGFFAYQDSQEEDGLLLELNSDIFYEFVPVEDYGKSGAKRLWLDGVELGKNYAMIISSSAGLWAYDLGDTVKFISKNPYRIKVSGRVKHYTSAFGEHVIAEEVEKAIQHAQNETDAVVTEFHVAPMTTPNEGLPYHEWFIDFETEPMDQSRFSSILDGSMIEQNPYYRDLIEGSVLRPLVVTALKKGAFREMMRARGKLGGQNKVPRLANDRKIAERLEEYSVQ